MFGYAHLNDVVSTALRDLRWVREPSTASKADSRTAENSIQRSGPVYVQQLKFNFAPLHYGVQPCAEARSGGLGSCSGRRFARRDNRPPPRIWSAKALRLRIWIVRLPVKAMILR